MLCGKCKKAIPESFLICPYCNNPNTVDNSLIEYLKQNITYLHSLKNYMETSLNNMETTIEKLANFTEKQSASYTLAQPKSIKKEAFPQKPEMQEEIKGDSLEKFLGEKFLLTLGIVTILFAAGFFLKYSFERDLFSPLVKVLLTASFGIIFIITGIKLRGGKGIFGNILTSGGIAITFFANFAGITIYKLYGFLPAILLNLILFGYSLKLADIFNSQWISIVGIGGAFLSPLFMEFPINNNFYFFYIFLLAISSLFFAYKKKWTSILLVSCAFSLIWYSDWLYNYFTINVIVNFIVLGNLLYLIYAISPVFYLEKNKDLSFLSSFVSIFFFPLFFSSACLYKPSITLYSSLFFVFSGLAMLFFSKRNKKIQKKAKAKSYIFSLGVLTIFIGIYFNLPTIIVTSLLAICAIFSAYTFYITERKWVFKISTILLAIIFLKFNFYDYTNALGFNNDYFFFITNENLLERISEFFIVTVALFFVQKIAYRKGKTSNLIILNLLTWLTIIIYLTFETASFFHYFLDKAQSLAVSILWALIAFVSLIYGIKAENKSAKRSAFFLFLIVLFKVFFIDISGLETIYKVVSFLIVGLILIISSYFYYSNTKSQKKGENPPEKI